jgi:glycosyltransferase involved in cell wall biosynthesis
MACGKAVVTSNISSLPEVAGDAGILVDPFSINAIRDGLAEALNPSRQSELGAAGRERAKTLTWYIAAEKTRAVYEEVLGGKR